MGANAAADKVGADICRLINDGQSSYYGCESAVAQDIIWDQGVLAGMALSARVYAY